MSPTDHPTDISPDPALAPGSAFGAAPAAAGPSQKGTWRQALTSFLLSVLMILGFRWAFFEPYVIPSGSMLPTLLIHDHILVNKFAYGLRVPFTKRWIARFGLPARGEVVVFNSAEDNGIFLVKRVIGLPGDVIEIDENGDLRVNGQVAVRSPLASEALARSLADWAPAGSSEFAQEHLVSRENLGGVVHYASILRKKERYAEGPFKVPEDHLFMMGDNRDNSNDSRVWGALPARNVLGRATVIWLSCEDTLKQAAQVCDPTTVRWPRLFRRVE